ncbi:protamine P1 [Colletotrichum costaricense]|uniref:Protamine P1 n=1 Tax=Colletotrichum costaricense TaxID=1209916 RepID=A0AAJ0E636_9PEZI|nr:protamine P1 [Colletotrichum costaricense]KAK1535043.1 protamine P1 [Colletotrichum costaricense]
MDMEDGWRVRRLDDEAMYCEAPHDESDILYASLDHEDLESLKERRRRYEEAATRFLQGHTPRLLSTVLRGPFEGPGAKGWVNPWQSSRKPTSAAIPPPPPVAVVKTTTEVEETIVEEVYVEDAASCHLPSPRSLDQPNLSPHPFMETEELERVEAWRNTTESLSDTQDFAWSLEASLSQPQSQTQRKRRSTGSEWLKRQDTKRRKAEDTNSYREDSAAIQRDSARLSQNVVQKQVDAAMEDETASLESSQINPQTPRKALNSSASRSHQQQLSQIFNKYASAAQDEIPAPLSTPIQTPQSNRKAVVKTGDDAPPSSVVTVVKEEERGEFETQQDESFLFRARPRNHAINTLTSSPLKRTSFGQVSSAASTSSIESDSQGDVQDLEGDTCMADDTKATSPGFSEEGGDQHSPGKDTVQRGESGESMSKPLGSEIALDAMETDVCPTKTTDGEISEMVEDLDQHLPVETAAAAGIADLTSSQEPTVMAIAASQDQEEILAPKEASPVPQPPTPEIQATSPKEPASQTSSSFAGILPNLFPQSPWSKLSQFIIPRTPRRPSTTGQSHEQLTSVNTFTAEGPNASRTPAIPFTASVVETSVSVDGTPDRIVERPPARTADRLVDAANLLSSPAVPASQQSPWNMDVPVIAQSQQQQQPRNSDATSTIDPSCQSPWTASPTKLRQAAQEALMSKLFNVAEPTSPSPLAPTAAMTPTGPAVTIEQPDNADTSEPVSPEPIFSIKSFANFLSPSPEKPRRRLNKTRLSGGHLPSTQNLIAATTNNPWESVQKSVKRVRWALLPNEVEGEESMESRNPHTPTTQRAASPPPETAVADLPTGEDDQYKKHFQAVSLRKRLHHHLLPSASQQVLQSPGPMAMAEAFVSADSFRAPPAPVAFVHVDEAPLAQDNADTQESAVDDVDDVLRNLNEFIEMVDVEADLARAKEEEQKQVEKQQQQRTSQPTSNSYTGGFTFDGMMDAGVWD